MRQEVKWLNVARVIIIACRLVLGAILVIGLIMGYIQAVLASALGLLIVYVQAIMLSWSTRTDQ